MVVDGNSSVELVTREFKEARWCECSLVLILEMEEYVILTLYIHKLFN